MAPATTFVYFCAFLHISPILARHQQLKEFISIWEDFSCPGTLIVAKVPLSDDDRQFLADVIQTYPVPINLFELENITSSWPHQRVQHPETVCYNLILFHNKNISTGESKAIRQLSHRLVLKNVLIIAAHCSTESAEKSLNHIQRERLIILRYLHNNSLEMIQWKIDGLIYHTELQDKNAAFIKESLAINGHQNLMGRKLKLATLHFPPAVFLKTDRDSNIIAIDGIEPSLINLLAYELNFTFQYLAPKQSEMWGIEIGRTDDENITLNGLRGQLMSRKADVAFGDLYIIDNWMKYYSFSHSFKTNYECFIVPSSKPYPKWMALILPFSLSTWIVLFVSVLVAVLTLHLIARLSVSKKDAYFGQVGLCLLSVIGNLMAVQQPRPVRSTTNRIFMISWLFLVTITSTAYRSGFISHLTNPIAPQPIQTIEQLAQSPLNKIAYSPYVKDNLQNSSDPFRQQLGHQMVTSDNISHMFSLLDSAQWAVDSSIDSLLYEVANRISPMAKNNVPQFHLMRECLFPTLSSFGLQKNSALKPYFDRGVLRMIETGLVQYHRSKFVKDLRDESMSTKSAASKELISFSLHNLQGAFYLCICGFVVSICTFLFELLIFQISQFRDA